MAKISGRETKPEIFVRKFLFSKRLRYRKNVKTLPGKPDIVLKRFNTVIFVHGCFWHGHKKCKKSALPSTNRSFWGNKIDLNIKRDIKNKRLLVKMGWKVIVIWQCQISNSSKSIATMNNVINRLK